jgi:centromere assembly component S (CENP-S)
MAAQDEDASLEEVILVSRYVLTYLADAVSQRLKSALWLSIGKIVDEETIKMGVNATPQFIGALTEMVWAQIGMYRNRQKRSYEVLCG